MAARATAPRPDRTPAQAPARPDRPADLIEFEYGIPDLASFPMGDWTRGLTEAALTISAAEMGDDDDAGSSRLREVVTSHHRRVRAGCAARPTMPPSSVASGMG